MSDGAEDSGNGRASWIIAIGVTTLIFGGLWVHGHFTGPAGYDGVWLSGQYVVGSGYTWDEGDKYARYAVLDLATGKHLEQRDPPDRMSVMGVSSGVLWFQRFAPRGIEGWSLPELKTTVSWDELKKSIPELQTGLADESLCFDQKTGLVRAKLLDGRWLVIDLATRAAVSNREVSCGHATSGASSGAQRVDGGWLGAEHEAGSERRTLAEGQAPNRRLLVPDQTFLDPNYLTLDERVIELGDDVLVLHKQSLATKARWSLSRVGPARLAWTIDLGTEHGVNDLAFADPKTLLLSQSEELFVIDLETGQLKWKAPN